MTDRTINESATPLPLFDSGGIKIAGGDSGGV
jgi:hypothetical protein